MKKKSLLIILIFLLGFLFYYNANICNFKRLLNSSNNFGFFYSLSFCNDKIKLKLFAKIKKILLNTSFEHSARKLIRSGNYEFINKEIVDNLKQNKHELTLKPKVKIGDSKDVNKKNFKKIKKNQLKPKNYKEWIRSHGGNHNLKFADYSEINLDNIKDLNLKWTYKEKGNNFSGVQMSPIYKDNVIYITTGNGKLIAINSTNGQLIWSIQSVKNISTRGIIMDEDIETSLYIPIEEKIYKIFAKTGILDKKFGINGSIKIKTKSAPIINKNDLCVGQMSPASIKCYDKKNGQFKFKVDAHPVNRKFNRGGTIWGNIAFDKDKEIIYVVTGNPRPALVGFNRPGANTNANSIIAIDLTKKNILWSHQDVIHDLWDYDVSAPPAIVDLKFNNHLYPSLIVISKIGNVYIFNRETGTNYFDIDYKKVPISKIIGEYNSHYQVKISKPQPLDDLKVDLDKFNQSALKLYKDKIDLKHFTFGEFEPPKLGGEVIINALHGGVSWTGFSVNPYKNIIFTPVNNIPYRLKLELKTYSKTILKNKSYNLYLQKCSKCHGKLRNGTFEYKSSFFNKNEMDSNVEYVPSLVGHSIFNEDFNKLLDKKYINKLHKFKLINDEEEKKLKKLFIEWDKKIYNNSEFFYKYNWSQFMSKKNIPATKPPWGEIVALDIISGKKLWSQSIGMLNGKMIGTPIYGGLASNSGEILVATGTYDNMIYFINQNNGEILKTFKMEAAGSSPPIIYKDKDGEKITVVTGTMNYSGFDGNSPTQIYTFSIN
jgi:quinoprotein glucose dehydrogenase